MSLFDKDRTEETQEADLVMPDGIYFDLEEGAYHALHRLSASGIKNMLVSVPTFWAKSWMNEERAQNDEDSTKAQILGRAYHVAIFEPETLGARYAGEPDLSAIDGILNTDTEVKAALKELGQPQSKAGENAYERAQRLVAMGYEGPIKAIILGEFKDNLGGRQPIGSAFWAQIEKDIERIEANPEILELVTGGFSEVTILWTCPNSGIKMKSRIDKLKSDMFVDLKSFANANGKPVNLAIRDQVQYYKYYLSLRVYQQAVAMIGKLDLQIKDEETSEARDSLIEALRARTQPLQPWLFFQEKGGVPNLLARKLKLQRYADGVDVQSIGAEDHDFKLADGLLALKADVEIDRAKKLFNDAIATYGTESEWYPFDMLGEIGEGDFSDWFLDTMPA